MVLEFNLIAEKDAKRDVLDVIQDLQKYSSPGINQRSGIDIEFPYYFEVITQPGEAIKYTTCALEAVQSTYNVPWVNGYPVQASLQLTFKDISPLFRQTIKSGSIINVISRDENTAYNQDPSATKSDIGNLRASARQSLNRQRNIQAQRASGNKPLSAQVGPGQSTGSSRR